MCKLISVSMAKGGVGKSITTINLCAALAELGERVLVIDNDPQGSMTNALGIDPASLQNTLSNLMLTIIDSKRAEGVGKAVIHVSEWIDLIPTNKMLAAVEDRLVGLRSKPEWLEEPGEISSESVMKTLIQSIRGNYNYILIDCPPSLGYLTINAMTAADSVLLPLEAHFLGYEALKQIIDTISRIKAKFNPGLEIEGILVTKYQSRTTLCNAIREVAQKEYGDIIRVFAEPIPYSIRAAEQPAHGASILEVDGGGPVASAYRSLAKEVLTGGR